MTARGDLKAAHTAAFKAARAWGKEQEEAKSQPNGAGEPDDLHALAAAALDLNALGGAAPPLRRFAWEPWVPARMATLLHGYGGAGKTLLLQQIATAYVLGAELFGGATEGRPALVVFGEDDHDEVWRRQLAICDRLGVRLDDLAGSLHLLAVPHLDITLATSTDAGAVTTTPMLDAVRRMAEQTRLGLVGLDNSAKLFAVPEGNRIAVTRCVGLLNTICQDFDATAVLVAHDNKDGQYSGSTAWENTCRSRLHLVANDDGTTTLRMPKANYSAKGEIKLRWADWSFRADDPAFMTYGERLDAEMTARQHAEVFLRALDRLADQGVNVSDAKRAGNHAPRVMIERDLNDGLSKQQLEAAMVLLLNEGRIKANQPVARGSDRHREYGLARTAAAEGTLP